MTHKPNDLNPYQTHLIDLPDPIHTILTKQKLSFFYFTKFKTPKLKPSCNVEQPPFPNTTWSYSTADITSVLPMTTRSSNSDNTHTPRGLIIHWCHYKIHWNQKKRKNYYVSHYCHTIASRRKPLNSRNKPAIKSAYS